MRLCASRRWLVAGAKPRRVLPRAGGITSRFESLESGVETNELPLAPRDATQTRVSALRGRVQRDDNDAVFSRFTCGTGLAVGVTRDESRTNSCGPQAM